MPRWRSGSSAPGWPPRSMWPPKAPAWGAPGGEHPLMGTHNRIINVSSPAHSRVYLEIIAINTGATPAIPAGARRWFDMDDAALQQQVAAHGPQIIHRGGSLARP